MRINLDLLKTPARNPAPQLLPSSAMKAVYYDSSEDGVLSDARSLENFERSEKGRLIVQQYRDSLDRLQEFFRTHRAGERSDDATRAFADFADRLEEGSHGHFSSRIPQLWGVAKRALETVVAETGNESIPLSRRLDIVENLIDGLQVCAPGAASHLCMAAQELALSKGGLREEATRCWESLLKESVHAYVLAKHANDPHFPSNEIHYVNGYRNYLADEFGVTALEDDFVPPRMADPLKLEECARLVRRTVNATALVRYMAESCLEQVRARLGDFCGRRLDSEGAWGALQCYDNHLADLVSLKYGPIDSSLIVFEQTSCSEGTDNADCYTVAHNPALLMRAIAQNLRNAGLIHPFKFDTAAEPERDGSKIKRVGDPGGAEAFYVKSAAGGANVYRALGLADLPRDAAPALMREALVDLETPDELRRLRPEMVWSIVLQDGPAEEWQERLGRRDVVRFRSVYTANDTAIIAQAIGHVASDASRTDQAFRVALRSGDASLAEGLLPHVSFFDDTDDSGSTALQLAALHDLPGLAGSIARLTQDTGFCDATGHTALMIAAARGHTRVIDALVRNGADRDHRNDQGQSALMVACDEGRLQSVEALLTLGADIRARDREGHCPLMYAARGGHATVAEVLVRRGAYIEQRNRSGVTALMAAVGGQHVSTVESLLALGAQVDATSRDGFNALSVAIIKEDQALISMLVRGGASVDGVITGGLPLLMLAAARNSVGSIKALLDAGARVDKPDEQGFNAAMVAAGRGNTGSLAALLEGGAAVERRDPTGNTLLGLACLSGEVETVELLLRHGASANATSAGIAPLFLAIERGNLTLVNVLLAGGAVADCRSHDGTLAIDVALALGHVEIASRLAKADNRTP